MPKIISYLFNCGNISYLVTVLEEIVSFLTLYKGRHSRFLAGKDAIVVTTLPAHPHLDSFGGTLSDFYSFLHRVYLQPTKWT